MAKKKFVNTNIICDKCGYQNKKEYIQYTGTCHLCGKVLDDKAHFKNEMNKKMRLWRGKKFLDWKYYE